MKRNVYKLIVMLVVTVSLLSACSGSRESMHHRSVNNSGFKGY